MKLIKAEKRMHWKKIYQLYQQAFPAYEKKPFWLIVMKYRQGKADVWYIEEEGMFAGLAITMSTQKSVLLDYFAIDEGVRGQGCGSKALKLLQEKYVGRDFFLEIESVYDECENKTQRERRKQFYLRNHMNETGMMVHLYGADMEILGYGCKPDFRSYCSVYEQTYGKRALKKLWEVPYPKSCE